MYNEDVQYTWLNEKEKDGPETAALDTKGCEETKMTAYYKMKG